MSLSRWTTGAGWLFVLSSMASSARALGQEAPSARLRGHVRTRSEAPLAAAEVTLLGTTHRALTDSVGNFVLSNLPPADYVVQVRRIGFRAQHLSAKLGPGEEKDVTIVLEPGAYQLPEVEVRARATKPIEYAHTTKYDDFFRRRAVGLGHYITRDQIDRQGLWRTASLLARVPGIRVNFRHPGAAGTEVWFSRGTACGASVWINGWKQRYAEFEAEGRLSAGAIVGIYVERVLPSEIEMIEVYRGPAEMPAEFLGDSCAAIVIWTR